MIKSFKDFKLNENSFYDLFKDNRTDEQRFYDDIRSNMMEIIMRENRVSEKSFEESDKISNKLKEMFKPEHDFRQQLDALTENVETAKTCRPNYWAERAYQEILKKSFNF